MKAGASIISIAANVTASDAVDIYEPFSLFYFYKFSYSRRIYCLRCYIIYSKFHSYQI